MATPVCEVSESTESGKAMVKMGSGKVKDKPLPHSAVISVREVTALRRYR